ncbi:MAG: porin PorA family protein, partial [Nostocoides sp.]
MRKPLGTVLLGLGGFLLTTALLLWFWVPGQVKQTPLNVNSTTRLAGTGSYLGEAGGPLKATSRTVVDGPKSKDGVVVFDTFTCLLRDPSGNAPDCVSSDGANSALINAGTDTFATDRHTALSVNAKKYVGADALQHDGLVNKFPFDTEKKTYPFWDSLLGRAVDAKFDGTATLDGLLTDKFHIVVDNEPAEISQGVSGTYSDDKTM